jgi:N4-gp56 family major capsid protein
VALPTAASVVSAGLAGYPSVYYDKVAVDTLQSNLFLYPALDLKVMPNRSGVVMQMFAHTKLAANTTAVTEGTPFAGQAVTQVTNSITLSEFADYITISSKVDKTQLIDQGAANAKLLAYRGALSVETIISNALVATADVVPAVTMDVATGTNISASKFREAAWGLRAVDAKPKSNGQFYGVAHSLTVFDLINDSAIGGLMDTWKNTNGNKAMGNGIGSLAATIGGVDIRESNVVKSYPLWQAGAKTAYVSWIIGADAIFGSSLGNTALGEKNFSVQMKDFTAGNSLDPAGLISKACVYHFFFGCAVRPGTVHSYRRLTAETTLS